MSSVAHLKGSPHRDLFKHMHKQRLPRSYYAADIDLALVDANPNRIVAFLDAKRSGQTVTWAEVIAYNRLQCLAHMYIVEVDDPENGPFTIFRYEGGDTRVRPHKADLVAVRYCGDWADFSTWEASLRNGGDAHA